MVLAGVEPARWGAQFPSHSMSQDRWGDRLSPCSSFQLVRSPQVRGGPVRPRFTLGGEGGPGSAGIDVGRARLDIVRVVWD